MDASYLVWQAGAEPLSIEFSRLAVEEIRQACYAAGNGILRGGKGIGGLLYGTRLGSLWRVLAWRPIHCSYPRGEAFHLSSEDEFQLEANLAEPPPGEMILLGWFASHPRGGLLLSPEERRIHTVFFSSSDRLMITMRTRRSGELVMAVHLPPVHEPGQLEAIPPEFQVLPMPRAEFESAKKATNGAVLLPARDPRPQPVPPPVKTTYLAMGFSGVLVTTAALAVLGWQLTQTGLMASPDKLAARFSPPSRMLSLHAAMDGRRLEVVWDPRAYDPRELAFAAVIYASSSAERSLELDSEALVSGRVSIPVGERPSMVTLSIRTSKGKALKETVQFLAPPGRAGRQKK